MSDLKKKITVSVPIYNELASLDELYERTTKVMSSLEKYDYEIVFFDDGSTDGSRERINELAQSDNHIKAIFYKRNYGYLKSIFYCVQQAKGDVAILLHSDLQNPPEEIPKLLEEWEKGHDVVLGVKYKSRENKLLYFIRTIYYIVMRVVFGMNLIKHATEFELFDKSFIKTLNDLEFKNPFLRALIMEYGENIGFVKYIQDKRNEGKSKFNISLYYDFAICGVVNMSKKLPRRLLILDAVAGLLWLIEFAFNFIPDAVRGYVYILSNALVTRGVFFMCVIILAAISMLMEFVINNNNPVSSKNIVEEEERINY